MTENAEEGRIRWQCRRGIKEVEVVLFPFFENYYKNVNRREQVLFERLLECHDADLFEWFTHRAKSSDPGLQEIVDLVLEKVAS